MASKTTVDYLLGELTLMTVRGKSVEGKELRELMAQRQAKLRREIFQKIIERAEDGDVAAVAWLEERGFLSFPTPPAKED